MRSDNATMRRVAEFPEGALFLESRMYEMQGVFAAWAFDAAGGVYAITYKDSRALWVMDAFIAYVRSNAYHALADYMGRRHLVFPHQLPPGGVL